MRRTESGRSLVLRDEKIRRGGRHKRRAGYQSRSASFAGGCGQGEEGLRVVVDRSFSSLQLAKLRMHRSWETR